MKDVPEHVGIVLGGAAEGSVAGDHLVEDDAVAPPVRHVPVLPPSRGQQNLCREASLSATNLSMFTRPKTSVYLTRRHVVRGAAECVGLVLSAQVP